MSYLHIDLYYSKLLELEKVGATNEGSLREAFDILVGNYAKDSKYVYVRELSIKNSFGTATIRPDGTLMNIYRIHKGYVESKDALDNLDSEIEKKIKNDGYPSENIVFQDGKTTVLIQDGREIMRVDMYSYNSKLKVEKSLDTLLKSFIEYKPKDILEFDKALLRFKRDVPIISQSIRELLNKQDTPEFLKRRNDFWESCKMDINPNISFIDINEMVIQHILTEELFKSIFNESNFHHENNIAKEIEALTSTFMTRELRHNSLKDVRHYYETLRAGASKIENYREKQQLLKDVYEQFYRAYNPKGADRLGVVYTPNEVVRFMVKSTDYLLGRHFKSSLSDKKVHILDPATGTGTFVTDIIDYIPAKYLEYKYEREIHSNEISILAYYVANLNIEFTYKQKMNHYKEYKNICFVDTIENSLGSYYHVTKQDKFPFNEEKRKKKKTENKSEITVIIGNPPYNANQNSFNELNSNKSYSSIDKRIKETFQSIFKLSTLGISTNRDSWVYDREKKNLESKINFFITKYNSNIGKTELKELDLSIKWSRDLQYKLIRKKKAQYVKNRITTVLYRPFAKKSCYADNLLIDRLTRNHYEMFGGNLDTKNSVMCIQADLKAEFLIHASDILVDMHYGGPKSTRNFPLYIYDKEEAISMIEKICTVSLETVKLKSMLSEIDRSL